MLKHPFRAPDGSGKIWTLRYANKMGWHIVCDNGNPDVEWRWKWVQSTPEKLEKEGWRECMGIWQVRPPIIGMGQLFLGLIIKDILPREKAECFWEYVDCVWNNPASTKQFIRHPWNERMILALCEHKFCGLAGCASSSKTTTLAMWALFNWMIDPFNTIVLVCSIEKIQARKLIWGDICDYFDAAENQMHNINGKPCQLFKMPGTKLTAPTPTIIPEKPIFQPGMKKVTFERKEKMGIVLIAADKKHGPEVKTKIIAYKAPRVILIVDEMRFLSEAILDAPSNLSKNPFFQMIGTSNPSSYFDPFGKFVTPKNEDWNAINEDTEEWEMDRGGVCLRFDGHKSPNVLMGRTIYPFLFSQKDITEAIKEHGSEHAPTYYSMNRGWFTPAGVGLGIYSQEEIYRTGSNQKKVIWLSKPTKVAFLDPSFTPGGDKAMARCGLVGRAAIDGKEKTVLLLLEAKAMVQDLRRQEERGFQIMGQFKKFCEENGITDPHNVGMDITGGHGYGDILAKLWNNRFLRLDFGGKASELPTGTNKKKAVDVYSNKVAEIWMAAKPLMREGQIKGIDADTAKELIERRTDGLDSKKRTKIESKEDYKARVGHSPDLCESSLGLIFLCRLRFGLNSTEQAGKVEVQTPNHAPNLLDWGKKRALSLIEVEPVMAGGGWGD